MLSLLFSLRHSAASSGPDEPILREIDALCRLPPAGLRAKLVQPNQDPRYLAPYPAPEIGSRRPLAHELYVNRARYIGKTELEFLHFSLIVLLRRDFQTRRHFSIFSRLWNAEGAFLTRTLDSRWLVSACDTFADHSPSQAVRATALAGSLLMNTIKLYESERFSLGGFQNTEHTGERWAPLFDGMSTFWIGGGDVVFNMKRRMKAICADRSPVSRILEELFERANAHDTAYRRMRQQHYVPETQW